MPHNGEDWTLQFPGLKQIQKLVEIDMYSYVKKVWPESTHCGTACVHDYFSC